MRCIRDHVDDHIDAYWGSKKNWEKIPDKLSDMKHFTDWENKIVLDHGYDETKPECERKSWNYGNRAKVDSFFAQVWNPLHEEDELREYPKVVSDLDV